MDFDSIVGIMMLVMYLLFQAMSNKKKKAKQKQQAQQLPPLPSESGPSLPSESRPSAPSADSGDELEIALREIREALGMGRPSTPPPVPLPPLPVSKPKASEPDYHSFPTLKHKDAFESNETFDDYFDDHNDHGFEWKGQFEDKVGEAEQAFENKEAYDEDFNENVYEGTVPKKKKVSSISEDFPKTGKKSPTSWQRQLRDAASARDAFIVGEILSRPKSQRPR